MISPLAIQCSIHRDLPFESIQLAIKPLDPCATMVGIRVGFNVQEVSPEDSEAKKGIGSWAKALSNNNYQIVYCSGELQPGKLLLMAKNAINKKRGGRE